jgi:hypothetical protein
MKLYADTPARRTRQLLSDVLMLLWLGFWVWAGRQVYDVVMTLRGPADSLSDAGTSVHDSLAGAGQQAAQLPLVGDGLRQWLDRAAGSGTSLRDAGTSMADTVVQLALVLGLVVAVVPVLTLGALWLFVRVRFVRRASGAQRHLDANADLDLFALRAMATQPMRTIAKITDDPAGAWRRRDARVIHALATLELREQGLRAPNVPSSDPGATASHPVPSPSTARTALETSPLEPGVPPPARPPARD